MANQVAINHRTDYEYDRPVSLAPHTLRLLPAPHCSATVYSFSLSIQPSTHSLNRQQDSHGTYLAHTIFPEPTS